MRFSTRDSLLSVNGSLFFLQGKGTDARRFALVQNAKTIRVSSFRQFPFKRLAVRVHYIENVIKSLENRSASHLPFKARSKQQTRLAFFLSRATLFMPINLLTTQQLASSTWNYSYKHSTCCEYFSFCCLSV
jgi:hypothetical protein